eukprot:3790862-Amphidinium_carterae.1
MAFGAYSLGFARKLGENSFREQSPAPTCAVRVRFFGLWDPGSTEACPHGQLLRRFEHADVLGLRQQTPHQRLLG